MKKIAFIVLCLSSFSLHAHDPDSKKIKKEADKAFELEHYRTARHFYKDMLTMDPGSVLAKYRLGICELFTFDYEDALGLIEAAVAKDPSVDKYCNFWLARAYHLNYQFDKAIQHYQQYMEDLGKGHREFHQKAEKLIEECENGKKLCALPSNYKISNLGDQLNSPYSEHSPIITQDGLTMYFTSRRDHEDLEYLKVHEGEFNENIYVSHLNAKGKWTSPKPLESLETGIHHEATVMLYDEDQKMLVYKNTDLGDLYETELTEEGVWSNPKSLKVNTKASESDAYIGHDGKILIFASSNHSHLDGDDLDLYISFRQENGNWGNAKPLSSKINTSYDENSPFLSKDGKTLYFSSSGHSSMGGYDVFKSEFDSTTMQWGDPINLGHPLNTPGDDIYFYYSDKNEWNGYFSSYRSGGLGEKDIYHVQFIPNVNVEGVVTDASTNKVVEGLEVTFLPREEVVSSEVNNIPDSYTTITDQEGMYALHVLSNEVYDVVILFNKDTVGVTQYSIPLLTDGAKLTYTKNFKVDMPTEIQKMLAESNTTNEVYEERIKSIEKQAEETKAVVAPSTYAMSSTTHVEVKPEYTPEPEVLKKTAQKPEQTEEAVTKESSLEHFHLKEEQFVSGCRSILRHVYFEFDKSDLKPESFKELNNLVCLLTEYPGNRLEISGHTDNIGSHAYNTELSQKRAQAIVDYLINQGVETNRLIAKGYGETRPLASNDDEKEGRKFNRRTEFYVISDSLSHNSH